MSTNRLGNFLRELRLEKKLPLRKVAAMADMDVAILSKMERGERKLNKEVVTKLGGIYQAEIKKLMILYLSDRVIDELGDDPLALSALQVAEAEIEYKIKKPSIRKEDDKVAIILKMQAYFNAQKLVTKAWIFGSFARGGDTTLSDIDVLIDVPYSGAFTLFDLADVQHELEKISSKKVDVLMYNGLRPEMKKRILHELQLIYET